jgi:hypothetical protein
MDFSHHVNLLIFNFIFRFLHKERNKKSLRRYTIKNLKAHVSTSANKYVNTNLCLQLVSWFKKLKEHISGKCHSLLWES